MASTYDRERWQVENTFTELQRHRLLSCVVAEHSLAMIDGLCNGAFKTSAIRNLVNIEQRWKELAQLTNQGPSCVESISNLIVHHLEEDAPLPWQLGEYMSISNSCVSEHHASAQGTAQQRLAILSNRHFDCYARMLTQLARLTPRTEEWYDYAAHTISSAVALGTHLDWVMSMKKK